MRARVFALAAVSALYATVGSAQSMAMDDPYGSVELRPNVPDLGVTACVTTPVVVGAAETTVFTLPLDVEAGDVVLVMYNVRAYKGWVAGRFAYSFRQVSGSGSAVFSLASAGAGEIVPDLAAESIYAKAGTVAFVATNTGPVVLALRASSEGSEATFAVTDARAIVIRR